MVSVLGRPSDEWLSDHARGWVDAGLLSPEQARAILRAEHTEALAVPEAEKERPGAGPAPAHLPIAAELASYLGLILVAASGAFVVDRFWKDFRLVGHLAVGLVVAGVGLVGGELVTRIGDRGARRLGGVLSLIGTAGVGLTAGIAADAAGSNSGGATAMAVGPAVLVVSLVLWRNRSARPLSFLSTVAGVAITGAGIHGVLGWHFTPSQSSFVIWSATVVLGVFAAARMVRPWLVAVIVAEIGAIVAALVMSGDHQAIGLSLGILTAVVAIIGGLLLKQASIVVVGVLGFLVVVGRTLAVYLTGTASALTILAMGIILVAVAIRVGTTRGHHRPAGV